MEAEKSQMPGQPPTPPPIPSLSSLIGEQAKPTARLEWKALVAQNITVSSFELLTAEDGSKHAMLTTPDGELKTESEKIIKKLELVQAAKGTTFVCQVLKAGRGYDIA